MSNWRFRWVLLAAALTWSAAGNAGVSQYCDAPLERNAAQHDKLLRISAVIKEELEGSGATVALISRSGLDLSAMSVRYSHSGFSLKSNRTGAWSVRQLYYACDEAKPRIFDQGLAAFLAGLSSQDSGFISVVLLPASDADPIEAAALDNTLALKLLHTRYSANAYPYSTWYQNCNQWVMELLASAWGRLPIGENLREQAQSWLRDKSYAPSEFNVAFAPVFWVTSFISWLFIDDHPQALLAENRMQVSMPASIEDFVRSQSLGARRIEFCHTTERVVIRRGWQPIADECTALSHDRVVLLN